MRPSNSEITKRFKQHLYYQFAKERRKACSLATGNPYSYVDTHLEEVPWRAAEIISRVRHSSQDLLSNADSFLLDIAARGHDLPEDGFGAECPRHCTKKPTCSEHYVRVCRDTRQLLVYCGLFHHEALFSVEGMRGLSKDFSIENSEERNRLFNLQLRKLIFDLKLVKLGDNWHNGETLYPRGVKKALKNYIKIRSSWPVIFTLEELLALCEPEVNMIEDPETMVRRTHLFTQLYKALEAGEDLPDCSIPFPSEPSPFIDPPFDSENPTYLYEQAVADLDGVINGDVRQKIRNVCLPSVLYGTAGGAEIPVAAERQIFMADMIETKRLDALCMFLELGLDKFHQFLTPLMFEDYEICLGKTGWSPEPRSGIEAWGMIRAFVAAVGMNGNELMRLSDEREFERIVKEAILREKAKIKTERARSKR